MSNQLQTTELKRRMCQFLISLQGANGALCKFEAVDGGLWQRSYLQPTEPLAAAKPNQHNIIGERVLGLPGLGLRTDKGKLFWQR